MGTADFPALEREGYAGKKLGRFDVMAKLGVGGMSEVFLAWQKAVGGFQRPVVLKRILEAVKRNEEFLRMFVKEAKITSALNHQGIAHLYELVHEDDELFMVMEFVPGATLVEVARACHHAREPIPIGFTASVVRDTAVALHYAHTFADAAGRSRPVIHRDVAEKNIMVGLDGMVKLLDFGIARQTDTPNLTQAGTVKGTAGYMSPEQVRGEKLDGRTDVFSLGVVLHECLTGQRLFRRNTLPEEVQALLEAPIHPPSQKNRDIPQALDDVTMKALQRDRTQRFLSAKEMAEAIEDAAGDELWAQSTRAEFIQRHFEVRQADIVAMLGDPSSTDMGDLLPVSRQRETRDEFPTVTGRVAQPLMEERTAEVRGNARRKMPVPPPGYPDDEPRTVLAPPPAPDGVRTVLEGPPQLKGNARRTEPALEEMTQQGRPPLDMNPPSTESVAMLDEGRTMLDVDDSEPPQRRTDEAPSKQELAPGRRRSKNLAAQKQALLMWIAIGSGLVLGIVLAAFLIFG
ncbi:MAG: serine/threonine protein kinase [Myxococcaceae bacterium]|nr:serine/threonine protein kinase [Myxococcaceae bacterium]